MDYKDYDTDDWYELFSDVESCDEIQKQLIAYEAVDAMLAERTAERDNWMNAYRKLSKAKEAEAELAAAKIREMQEERDAAEAGREAAERELARYAWRPMRKEPDKIGTYIAAMWNANGDGFYYDSIFWLPWEKFKDDARRRAFNGDCEWFIFEDEWPPIHVSPDQFLCWMETDSAGVEELLEEEEEREQYHAEALADAASL